MKQTEQMMEEWMEHRLVLEKLLGTIDDDRHMDFKPWDGAMSLGQLALHVAYWGKAFVSMVKTGEEMSAYFGSEPDLADFKTMEDIRKAVHDFTGETKTLYASLTESELEAGITSSHPRLGGQPRKFYLTLMYDHEVHHKGQLFVYARMVGVKEVPFFR